MERHKSLKRTGRTVTLVLLAVLGVTLLRTLWGPGDQATPVPKIVTLASRTSGTTEESWIAVRNFGPSTLDQLRLEIDESKIAYRASGEPVPIRTFFVYVSPYPQKDHKWNTKTDEPNYVVQFQGVQVKYLKVHSNRYRDENNNLMPEGWRPPPPEPKPWYIPVIKSIVGLIALFILMSIVALIGRRGGRSKTSSGPTDLPKDEGQPEP